MESVCLSVLASYLWTLGQPWADAPRDSSWRKLIFPLPAATNSFLEDNQIFICFCCDNILGLQDSTCCESDSLMAGTHVKVGREQPSQSSHSHCRHPTTHGKCKQTRNTSVFMIQSLPLSCSVVCSAWGEEGWSGVEVRTGC